MTGSRWERAERWPFKVVAVLLVVIGTGTRFVPSLSHDARAVATIVGLPLVVAGLVLLCGPWLHRLRRQHAAEIQRNPTGTTMPLDDRLAHVDHPRARWVGMLLLALVFALGTVWAVIKAVTGHDGAFVGAAIYLFIPVPVFAWLAWRSRALLSRRP